MLQRWQSVEECDFLSCFKVPTFSSVQFDLLKFLYLQFIQINIQLTVKQLILIHTYNTILYTKLIHKPLELIQYINTEQQDKLFEGNYLKEDLSQ